jgi:hypothetical protein
VGVDKKPNFNLSPIKTSNSPEAVVPNILKEDEK